MAEIYVLKPLDKHNPAKTKVFHLKTHFWIVLSYSALLLAICLIF